MAKVEVLNIDTSQSTSSIKALRQQLKELKDQMAGLEEGSEEFLKVAASAGEVKHQIDEIQQSVNGASADFGDMLSSATGALNGIIGGFTAAQGVMNLFGIESEATVEAMKKLQALMAIGQGIAQIDNGIKAFNKFANAIKTTEIYQKLFNKTQLQGVAITKQDTAATVAGTVAKNASTVATKLLTNATRAFSAVLKGIGIGALIAAVSLLVEGLKQLASWFRNNFDETTKFQKKIENAKIALDALETSLTRQQAYNKFKNEITAAGFAVDDLAEKINNFNGTFQKMIENERMFAEEATLSSILQTTDDLKEYEKTLTGISDVLNELGQTDKYKYIGEDVKYAVKQFDSIRRIKGVIDIGQAIRNSSMSENAVVAINDEIQELEKIILKQEALLQKDDLARGLRKEVEKRLEKNKLTLKQLTNASEYYRELTRDVYDYAEKHNEELLKKLELERERKQNANEIYKIQIDTVAQLNENYKNSEKYLEDQIKYYDKALALTQKGSKEWENINSQVRILINNFYNRLLNGETLKPIESLKEGVIDIEKELEKIPEQFEKNISRLERWVPWSERTVMELNRQLNIVGETLGRLTESSLGFSTNWNVAFADTQKAIMSFAENIAKNGETTAAKWAQSFALGAQAVGTILNTLSEEQDGNTKEGFEAQKKYQIGATVLNTAAGIVNAWVSAMSPNNAYLTLPGQIALAGTTTAALAALAGVQIAKIQKAQFGGEAGDLSSGSITSTLVAPTQYTQAVQNANIESKLDDQRVYVVESDINKTGQRVSVQESENTY